MLRTLALILIIAFVGVALADPNSYKFIVVGGGAAGCSVAAKLADHPSRPSVLLLERGTSTDDPRLDNGIDALIPNPQWHDQIYHFPVQQGAAITRQPHYATQYAMGGNTRIYGHVSNVASKEWFDLYMPTGYKYANLLPRIKADEDHYCNYLPSSVTGISAADCLMYHGRGGAMKVAFPTLSAISQPMKDLMTTAAATAGYGFTNDYNNPNTREGFGWEQHFRALADPTNVTSSRTRVNAWNAFLTPAFRASHPNLVIETDATVTQLLFVANGNRVQGVSYIRDGQQETAVATKEVILCAGVVHTPQLLQLNGIGPADLLQSLGIPVRVNNSAVGRGLLAHQGVFNDYELNQALLNDPRYHGVGVGAAHIKSGMPTSLPADIQLELLEGVMAETSDGYANGPSFKIISNIISRGIPDAFRFLGVVLINNQPTCSGTVNVTTRSPLLKPQLDYGWTDECISNSGDSTRLLMAYLKVKALLTGSNNFTAQYSPKEVYPDNRWKDELASKLPLPDSILSGIATDFYRRYSVQPFYHVTSSCRLGECTDLDGRVKGVSGLRICDNSLLPYIPDANPTKTMLAMCSEITSRILLANM